MLQVAGYHNFGRFRQPLFVYGSFMFPSILRNRSEMSTLPDGKYSKSIQRRLRRSSSDWSGIDCSLQHAAEKMTLAILRGYEGWKPGDFSCAAIRKGGQSTSRAEETPNNIEVCDEMFSGELFEGAYRVRGQRQNTG